MTFAAKHSIQINKERFKFSSAHMTIFPNKTKESLHGHNYQVSVQVFLNSIDFESTLDFSIVKECLTPLCAELDERILLALHNPLSKIQQNEMTTQIEVLNKNYQFPSDEVLILPVDNITTEALSMYLGDRFAKVLLSKLENLNLTNLISAIQLCVYESEGQSACYLKEV